jgi:hypothetical protein
MDDSLQRLRDAALGLFTAAREKGEYEIAYHALCAVLHAAESAEDEQTCRLVAARAGECRDWIDLHAPRHKLSTQSAQSRGHESIFRQLVVMAESARLRLAADPQKKKGRP